MRILIVDDEKKRHDYFAQKYARHYLSHTYTAQDAITRLGMQNYDIVHLDHDLWENYPGYVDELHNGMVVTRALAHVRPRPMVIVHSRNPDGGRKMADFLRMAGFIVKHQPWRWQEDRAYALATLGLAYPELDHRQVEDMLT